ncbi:MAG: hypothetical protein CMF75_09220 [Maricaulis sp.]|nr:hypothetical protein [Maricaulis sp.]
MATTDNERSSSEPSANDQGHIKHMNQGFSAPALTVLGWVTIVGSIALGATMLPESGGRYAPSALQFLPGLAIMVGGSVQGIFLVAFGQIVRRLNQLVWINLSQSERDHEFGSNGGLIQP